MHFGFEDVPGHGDVSLGITCLDDLDILAVGDFVDSVVRGGREPLTDFDLGLVPSVGFVGFERQLLASGGFSERVLDIFENDPTNRPMINFLNALVRVEVDDSGSTELCLMAGEVPGDCAVAADSHQLLNILNLGDLIFINSRELSDQIISRKLALEADREHGVLALGENSCKLGHVGLNFLGVDLGAPGVTVEQIL